MVNLLKWSKETTLDQKDIEKFLAIHGKKGVKTLSLLGKRQIFYAALQSEIGQILLHDLMVRIEEAFSRLQENIRNYKPCQNEMTEYNTLQNLFVLWSERIISFEESKKKIKNL